MRLTKADVEKRGTFLRKLFEKGKAQNPDKPITLGAANEALHKEFGSRMNAKAVTDIRSSVYGSKVKAQRGPKKTQGSKPASRPASKPQATPTTAARSGRPAVSNGVGLFVLSGTQESMAQMLKLADAAGVTVTVDEGATQAVNTLRAHG
jgi:hypothetical protein